MKNNMLPDEIINILGDKIKYIPSLLQVPRNILRKKDRGAFLKI